MTHLLDTDTCVAVLRGRTQTVERLQNAAPDDCGISSVTAFELFAGAAKARLPERERGKIEHLLEVVAELPFDANAARRAGELRALLDKHGTPIGPYDLLIAAHALTLGLTLVTGNTREFSRAPG